MHLKFDLLTIWHTGIFVKFDRAAPEHLNVQGSKRICMHARGTAGKQTALHVCTERLHRCKRDCIDAPGHFTRAARSARKNGRLHGSKRLCTRAHRTACIHAGLHANIPECTQASETACVHAPVHASKRGLHATTRFCTQAGAIARKHSRLQACRSRRAHARCGARCLRHLPAAIARLPAGAGPNSPS